MRTLLTLLGLITSALASDCLVSQWTAWSECFGDCSYAVKVRNRDVITPPLPEVEENLPRGTPFIRLCPSLYETVYCKPQKCLTTTARTPTTTTTTTAKPAVSLSELLESSTGDDSTNLNMLEQKINNGDIDPATIQAMLVRNDGRIHGDMRRAPEKVQQPSLKQTIEKPNKPFSLPSTIEPYAPQGTVNKKFSNGKAIVTPLSEPSAPGAEIGVLNKLTIQLPEIKGKHMKGQGTVELSTSEPTSTSESSPISTTLLTTTVQTISSTIPESVEIVSPVTTLRPTVVPIVFGDLTTVKSAVELQDFTPEQPIILESTTPVLLPMDEKTIRKALKKNKKLMKALIDAVLVRKMKPSMEDLNKIGDNIEATVTQASKIKELNETTLTTTTEIPITSEKPSSVLDISAEKEGNDNLRSQKISKLIDEVPNPDDLAAHEKQEKMEIPAVAQIGVASTSEASTVTFEPSKENSTETAESDVSSSTEIASTTRGTWSRKGNYVPNTRRHASEITDKLYLTHEIVQVLSADAPKKVETRSECVANPRCCQIEREECSDGTQPYYVKRYYRPAGSQLCVPYHYPRCDSTTEMNEQPIKYEQNCQDLCFTGMEKRIAPLYALVGEQ